MRTKPLFFIGLTFLAAHSVVAQSPKLTVETAVKQGWGIRPKMIAPSWIADTDEFSHLNDQYTEIYRVSAKTNKRETVFTLADYNTMVGSTQEYISFERWLSADELLFDQEGVWYVYNVKTKKSERRLSYPVDEAENADAHYKKGAIAYTIGNNLYIATEKEAKIAVTSEANKAIVSGQSIARNEFGISKGTFWSPDGEHLAFYQKDESKVTDYPLLDINKIPAEIRTIKYPMVGQGSEYARIGIYNLKNQKTVYLKTDGTQRDQYLTNLGWSADEKSVYVALINREQNHVWLNRYNAKTGELEKTILEETHDKYVEPEHAVHFLPGKTDEFLWASERDGFMHLYHYNADGQLIRQVTKGKWVFQEILGFKEKGKEIVVQGTDETGLNSYAYSVNMTTGETVRMTAADGMHYCQLSSDGKWLLDSYSSLNVPGVVQVINTHNNKVEHVLHTADNPLKNYAVGKVEMVDLKAEDGTVLHGRLIKPSDFNPNTKYPVLIYVYGGPHAQMINNSWLGNADPWMLGFAERGYLVFTLDNRGSANRGLAFENAIHRQLGTVELADQLKGVDYLKSLPFVDAKKLGVHGWSFGGFMTLTMLLRSPETFDVGVAGGAVTDWKFYEVMYGERYMDMPQENPEGYRQSSTLNHVTNLKADLLVVHGGIDDVVVPQHTYALMQSFIAADKRHVDFYFYPNQKHGVRGGERLHLMEKMLGYIEQAWKN